jgi:hypothetical protein
MFGQEFARSESTLADKTALLPIKYQTKIAIPQKLVNGWMHWIPSRRSW